MEDCKDAQCKLKRENHFKEKKKMNFINLCQKRDLQEIDWRTFTQKIQVNHTMINNLRLNKQLEGHTGCVNCIEFSENGDLLLSGSDDFTVILWDIYKKKKVKSISTGHRGNIFSVKFLPQPDNNMIVSGAADYKLEVREINSGDVMHVCQCHTERVKRIATVPSIPHMFFSASEDGTVMQFDTRKKHTCSSQPNNVLINLKQHVGRNAECKCIAIHPLRSELIAVGSSDPFIRVYDRRMIKLTSIQYPPGGTQRPAWERNNYAASKLDASTDNLPPGCVQYFVPGHLPAKLKDYFRRLRSLATTYLSYSSDGSKLMANLGGDHIYLFDTVDGKVPKEYTIPAKPKKEDSHKACGVAAPSNGVVKADANGSSGGRSTVDVLPPRVETLRLKANRAYASEDFTQALEIFNLAIHLYSHSPTLYSARAATRIKRKWDGDIYAALKDCDKALEIDSLNEKARYRQVRCLHLLGRDQEAKLNLEFFQDHYPPHLSTSPAWAELQGEIFNSAAGLNSSSSEDECDETLFIRLLPPISPQEKEWRGHARDYEAVYCGHCNTTTDIKEAVFVGRENKLIAAGSDDGNLFIWDRETTNLVRIIEADSSIVNCVQSHPNICMLATSGIESVVKLWTPCGGQMDDAPSIASTRFEEIAKKNQLRMCVDPVEMMVLPMDDISQVFGGRWGGAAPTGPDADDDFATHGAANNMQCRPS